VWSWVLHNELKLFWISDQENPEEISPSDSFVTANEGAPVKEPTLTNNTTEDSTTDDYSLGLSRRQSRGKYERSKYIYGREIDIQRSPEPSLRRKPVTGGFGGPPWPDEAPLLFARAKKYILAYPTVLASELGESGLTVPGDQKYACAGWPSKFHIQLTSLIKRELNQIQNTLWSSNFVFQM